MPQWALGGMHFNFKYSQSNVGTEKFGQFYSLHLHSFCKFVPLSLLVLYNTVSYDLVKLV